jgi:hypothetical protein
MQTVRKGNFLWPLKLIIKFFRIHKLQLQRKNLKGHILSKDLQIADFFKGSFYMERGNTSPQ